MVKVTLYKIFSPSQAPMTRSFMCESARMIKSGNVECLAFVAGEVVFEIPFPMRVSGVYLFDNRWDSFAIEEQG